MRYFFMVVALPIGFFWSWYFLAKSDFGYGFFSRYMYDEVFNTYGAILGVEPETIPPLVARACIVDVGLILVIWAFRRRREILQWVRAKRSGQAATFERRVSEAGQAHPAG